MERKGTDNGMIRVTRQNNEDIELMIKRFKHKCSKAGIIEDYRRRMHFQSLSETSKAEALSSDQEG